MYCNYDHTKNQGPNMKHLFIFVILNLSFLIVRSCSENGVKPPPPEENLCEIVDSTSHDFSWQVDTLGVWPSALYDVVAIDPNNVWAVGEVWTPEKDTVWHNDNTRNNAVKWNGSQYEYYQLGLIGYGGNTPTIQELRVALAFSTENIWFFSGTGSYIHWNGFDWKTAYILQRVGGIKSAWGVSSNDFYIVGNNGSITHYDGNAFTLMESGTDRHLHDVTGYVDPETGITHVWAAGELILLHYDGTKWEKVWDENAPILPDNYIHPGAIFAPDPKQLLVAAWYPQTIRGYCLNTKDVTEFKELFRVDLYAYAMDGPALNDFFIVGSWNKVAHFNGNSIKEYTELTGGSNRSVSYIDDNVFIVGPLAEQLGLFIRGTRN
jgi:hypothetical protein